MAKHASVSPLTRIEGHLAIHTDLKEEKVNDKITNKVEKAYCEGEMFRGFEQILYGRDPLDAQQITQRICGVCPISHGIASVLAQDMAYGIKPTKNGRLIRNLILAGNYLQSHIIHFYQLSALDFVDVTAVLKYNGPNPTMKAVKAWVQDQLKTNKVFPAAPLLPRWDADYIKDAGVNCGLLAHYVEALEVRRKAHEMCAVFAGKIPHSSSIVPGGCTQVPYFERILEYKTRLKDVELFIHNTYVPDVITAAKAYPHLLSQGPYDNFLSYGVLEMSDNSDEKFFPSGVVTKGRLTPFDQKRIEEEIKYSRFSSNSKLHPGQGATKADAHKNGAYTWLKAPRYAGEPMEVGPLARVLVGYHTPGCWIKPEVDAVLKAHGLKLENVNSLMGRHLCRGLEAIWIAKQAYKWLDEVEVNGNPAQDFSIPKKGYGYGLTEAPRGALGHWINIEDYKIKNYQCVVPTTWNCSPRDDNNVPGPIEKALEGIPIKNPKEPMEIARLVRSFDPCIACAVH